LLIPNYPNYTGTLPNDTRRPRLHHIIPLPPTGTNTRTLSLTTTTLTTYNTSPAVNVQETDASAAYPVPIRILIPKTTYIHHRVHRQHVRRSRLQHSTEVKRFQVATRPSHPQDLSFRLLRRLMGIFLLNMLLRRHTYDAYLLSRHVLTTSRRERHHRPIFLREQPTRLTSFTPSTTKTITTTTSPS
jgi:hypothetical protein